MTFKQLRTKINSKMKVIKALQHWEDPVLVRGFRNDAQAQAEQERYDKVLKQIYLSYKTFFEELLTSRDIPFYTSEESLEPPHSRHDDGFTVEYTLVNNTENVPTATLDKQDFSKITLSWLPNNRLKEPPSPWGRQYEKVMSIKKVGLAAGTVRRLRRSAIKSFKSMRESTFTAMIDNALNENKAKYAVKIEDFKALKTRVVTNKIEEDKLKDYLVKNVISVVDAEFLDNSAMDFEKGSFSINIGRKNAWRSIAILDISTNTDDLEKLTIGLNFFGVRDKKVSTADEAIAVLNSVLENNLRNIMDTYKRASSI